MTNCDQSFKTENIFKDGKVLSKNIVNRPDPKMTQVQIPDYFLSKVLLGRCNRDFQHGCSPPGGQFTDLNIWDSFLEEDELKDWTKCR